MVREHALLPVVPGCEEAFEAAFLQAERLVAASPGFRGLTLSRCVERPSRYLLLVDWDSVEDHEVGFRGSPAHQRWRELLHGSYDPFPVVAHFELVTAVGTPRRVRPERRDPASGL